MAIDKKTLQRFLDNPASFSAEDMGLDEQEEPVLPGLEDQLPPAPEEMLEPEIEEPEVSPQAPESDELEDEEGDIQLASARPAMPQADENIMAKLKKLKAGEPIEDDGDEQESADVASDMRAPTDLRKKALQRIKQKYLGQ